MNETQDLDEIIISDKPKFTQSTAQNSVRRSNFRGVSKNGNQWQAMFMFEMRKEYLGTFQTELQAARTYDKVHILVHGIKARTNFSYTKR